MQLVGEQLSSRSYSDSILEVLQLPFWSRLIAGRWSAGLLAAIDGAPIKMLRSKSTESGGRGWDVARL